MERSAPDENLLRIAIPGDENTLQPYTYVTGYPGWNLLTLVYDTLFILDRDNQPRPWIAVSDTVSADGLTHRVALRDDARWHDGRPLTSADVAFTFGYYRDHIHGRWTQPVRNIARVETPDAVTLVLTMEVPEPSLVFRLLTDLPILPKHIWDGVSEPKAFAADIGSGPFRLAEYRPGQVYRLTANREHFAGAPAVAGLVLPIITEPASIFSALKAGEIDATTLELPAELVPSMQESDAVRIAEGTGSAATLLQFNNEREPWSHADVRQAVALAIDTKELVARVLLGRGTPGGPGWLHPSTTGSVGSTAAGPDVAAARRLLDSAGYHDPDGDGVRQTPGGAALSPVLLVQANHPQRVRAAELIAQAVRTIGIDARVRAVEAGSLTDQVWRDFDVSKGRDFDWAVFGWAPPMLVDRFRVTTLVDSDPRRGTNNIGGFRNADVDRVAAELRRAAAPDDQRDRLHALDALIARERPFVMLWYADLAYAYRPRRFDRWVFQAGQGIFHKLSFDPSSTW